MNQIMEIPGVWSKLYSPWFQQFPLQVRSLGHDVMAGADDPGSASPDMPPSGGLDDASSVELVARARDGDREALDHLITRYRPILKHWAAGRLPAAARDLVDTEDLIQDTLIKTLRNVEHFTPRHDGALGAYLRQALSNRLKDEVRRVQARPRREPLRDEHADDEASPLQQAIGIEALRRYEQALGRLSEEDRELVLARIEMGLTYEQIARAMSKPSADAARMAVARALVRLAREMDHE